MRQQWPPSPSQLEPDSVPSRGRHRNLVKPRMRGEGEEWSVNIKVWGNVLGGHSTVQYVYSYVASPGLCSPHRHSVSVLPSIPFIYPQPTTRRNRPPLHVLSRRGRDERHPSHVTRAPTNPLSEFAISLADYGPIDEELKRALPREWRWSVAAQLLAD
ncbi:hypothetical protein B0H13DRAFT_2648505 [Mycena leptocephala]|nr:hypothetical protein B0H13DRAFT_2648505 [Mycena leptocephala]